MIPLSPIIGLGTFVTKAIAMIWLKKNQQRHQESMDNQALLASVDRSRAEARSDQSPEASIARRTVIISMTMALVVVPVLAPLFGIPVAVSWNEIDPGFLWGADREVVKWATYGDPKLATVAVAPVLYDLYAMMIGYYVGGKVK